MRIRAPGGVLSSVGLKLARSETPLNDIHQLLRKAAWRLGVANFLLAWVGALCAGLAGAIILRLVQQAVVFDVDWRLVAIGAAAGSVVAAIIAV